MKINKIITLASKSVEIRFKAMERSLRDVGCQLPLWVIPYNNERFDLPPNASWWEIPEITSWLEVHHCHKAYRKYQCLLTDNYQFLDTDIILLRNPEEILSHHKGFITSCGHWRSPAQTYTRESAQMMKEKRTSLWEKNIFNTGQFACDRVLYTLEDLKKTCESDLFKSTCLQFRWHEQPGINMLVNATDVPIYNLTLPPLCMESTWAGDYYMIDNKIHVIDYDTTWKRDMEKKPYLIHWAGCDMGNNQKINNLILHYLKEDEKIVWQEWSKASRSKPLDFKRIIKNNLKRLLNKFLS